MGMNDGGLSPREHVEMRDLVLAGAQRIRAQRAHRTQFVAAAVALVLVVGATGGVVTTAALIGSGAKGPVSTPTVAPTATPSPTPTQSPSPTPTPTPAPPDVPAGSVVPFAGRCANVMTDAAAASVTGQPMTLSDHRWKTGAESVLGGIDCLWLSSEEYLGAEASVYAYPESVVPAAVEEAVAAGCIPAADAAKTECSAVGVIDGTWLLVRTVGDSASGTPAAVETLFQQVAAHLQAHAAPAPAAPTAAWWEVPDCQSVADGVDPALLGFTRVEQNGSIDGQNLTHPGDIPVLAGTRALCGLHFTYADGTPGGFAPQIGFFPGGALEFGTALAVEGAQPVTVAGAEAAVVVPGNDRYEGSWEVLLVSDGVNVLAVYGDGIFPPAQLIPLAEAILAIV